MGTHSFSARSCRVKDEVRSIVKVKEAANAASFTFTVTLHLMKNKAAIGLLGWLCCACNSTESVPHFANNRVVYQQTVQAILKSGAFRQHIQQQQTLKISRAEANGELAVAALLFEKESIESIEINPDSSFLFRFPPQEGFLGISTVGVNIVYLPDKKYWQLPNSKIPNTTMHKNQNLGNGWFQSKWFMNIDD